MGLPNFSALFSLLDRVLGNWDKAQEARRKKRELRKRADEILERHTKALNEGRLNRLDREELANIMRIADRVERCERLVQFDERTR